MTDYYIQVNANNGLGVLEASYNKCKIKFIENCAIQIEIYKLPKFEFNYITLKTCDAGLHVTGNKIDFIINNDDNSYIATCYNAMSKEK